VIGTVASIALRVAACAIAAWIAWRMFGTAGLVFVAPLVGLAFARPLVDLAAAASRAMHRAHWRDVEGRHHAFGGRPVSVLEDADGQRWIRLGDVRAIVGFTASDGTLAVTYPDGLRRMGRPVEPYIGAEALLVHLGKEHGPKAIRLRTWVEREIAFPARRERERQGNRASSAERRARD
jgi:hypothetical protein